MIRILVVLVLLKQSLPLRKYKLKRVSPKKQSERCGKTLFLKAKTDTLTPKCMTPKKKQLPVHTTTKSFSNKQTNKPISKLNFPPQNNKRYPNQKEEPKQESQTTHTMVT